MSNLSVEPARAHLALAFAVTLIVACEDGEPAADGEQLYRQPHADGNTFACATCHALTEPAADGFTRPGHPIGDAALRTSWKNGQLTSFLDAVNTCRTEWLAAPAFAEGDARWQALQSFLMEEAQGAQPEALVFEIVDPPADVNGGDEAVGEDTFNNRCVVCHGESGGGTERAPALAGTMLPGDFIAQRIRLSGSESSTVYPGLIQGRMPFWSADRISDDQIRDVIAFLAMSEPIIVPDDNSGGQRVDLSREGAQQECGSSHPAVGSTLSFSTVAHAVAGSATIVDDCTIHLDDFSFDGGGIDVHILGGDGGDYDGGVDLSLNMVGQSFTQGSGLVRLPSGVTLDDFDGLSVWCVPVAFSFGDGQFE